MLVTFNCERCGAEKIEPNAWYKKRKRHFCSRDCANKSQIKHDKPSRQEYEKEYWNRPENKERRKEMSRSAYVARMSTLGDSYVLSMLSRAKSRALSKCISFDIEKDDVVIPEYCPILNVKLELHNKQGGGDNSPALDRIDNNKGYIKGNIQVISSKANRIKSNATIEEIKMVYMYLQEYAHVQYTGGLTLSQLQQGGHIA